MGCGISTLNGEDGSPSRNRRGRERAIVPPVATDNSPDDGVDMKKPLVSNKEEAKTVNKEKEIGSSNEEKMKKRCVMDKKEEKEEGEEEERVVVQHDAADHIIKKNIVVKENNNEEYIENDDNSFIGPGSPSFREYCIDYGSIDRSSQSDSNDYYDSGDSTINSSGHNSRDGKNTPKNEQRDNSYKESERKERRGRGFRNVLQRGKGRGGKRNLLNFGCYNASSDSYAEGGGGKTLYEIAHPPPSTRVSLQVANVRVLYSLGLEFVQFRHFLVSAFHISLSMRSV
ncbi:hypothetical protein RIF29_05038 [Crotalaria pallida]|uniref:Uncharacterized protein n=1 Tax=Crotalaria pallida TaxID=3830 RepID=A0AAN9P9K2_CROPI